MGSAPVRKATTISTKTAVSAGKVLACEPVGTTLVDVPARTLVAESAIGLSVAITLPEGYLDYLRLKFQQAGKTPAE